MKKEIANLKLKGEAEAQAIINRSKALENLTLPMMITSDDWKYMGFGDLFKEAANPNR